MSAGPGSGKTRVIVARIGRMIKNGVNPLSILATTFTKKAADEMNERLHADGVNTDNMAVQTMHSFCYRLLREEGYDDWEVDDSDRYSLILKKVIGFQGMKWRGADITEIETFISLAKNALVRPETANQWGTFLQGPFFGDPRFIQAYFEAEEIRRHRRLLTFDDMLIDGVELLEGNARVLAKVQSKYEYVIVDEFQDSNLAQVKLMELVTHPQWNLMVVGDVDQCHPAGTIVQTPDGEVPIEDLNTGDRVRVWNRHSGRIVGSSQIRVASHRIYDEMFEVKAGELSVEATTEHKFFVRWNKEHERWVTYLMYREDLGYRIGWCKLFANKNRIYHLGQRARLEKADKAWILSVHDNPRDASIEESIVSLKWRIPTAMFEPIKEARHYDRDAIKKIFSSVDSFGNGERCLREYGRHPDFPLYEHHKMPRGGNARRIFTTTPGNIFPEIMSVPTVNGWLPVDEVNGSMFYGYVYSLDVEKHHNYVANGIIVHNCIYEWRGAVPKFMIDFPAKHDASIISMGINYRCAPNIMGAAARCIAHNRDRDTKDLVADKTDPGVITTLWAEDLDEEANIVADEVEQLKNDGMPTGAMFVLYRTNAQSRAIEEVFSRRKIPHVVLGSSSFYQRKEVQDLLAYLKLVVDPMDEDAGGRAINRPFRFISRMDVDKMKHLVGSKAIDFMEAAGIVASDNPRIAERVYEFDRIIFDLQTKYESTDKTPEHELWTVGNFISEILERTAYLDYLAQNEGSDTAENSREANVGELVRSADRYKSIPEFLAFVKEQIEERKRRKKKVKNAVTCMTMHRAKGLEARAVFLIGSNEGIIPHAHSEEPHEEERRLFYVGMTRAMENLHITAVRKLGMAGSEGLKASRFIEEAGLTIKSLTPSIDGATVPDPAGDQVDADTK